MNESSPSLPHPKIHRHHQERLAVVYVRQSTAQQMTRHPESTRLQYGLVDRALTCWSSMKTWANRAAPPRGAAALGAW